MRSKALLAVLLVLAIGGAGGHAFAQPSHINWQFCEGDNCFIFAQPEKGTPYNPSQQQQDMSNRIMDIILPDGTCDITGHLLSDGSCSASPIVLSADNYTRLQNNVAFMAVVNIKDTTIHPTTNYCPLAQNIWDGQTETYQKKLQNVTQFVVPPECSAELTIHVPEFAPVATIVLAIAVMSIIVVASKSGLRPQF